MARFTIDISENQMKVLVSALEMYSRVHLGLFSEVARIVAPEDKILEKEMQSLAPRLTKISNTRAFFNIIDSDVPPNAKIACDLANTIKYYLSWIKHPSVRGNTSGNTPYMVSKEPVANVEQTQE